MTLTKRELAELTGHRVRAFQRIELDHLGIRYGLRADDSGCQQAADDRSHDDGGAGDVQRGGVMVTSDRRAMSCR